MCMCTCMYVPEQVCGSQKTTSGVHPHLPPCSRPGLMFTTTYGRLSGQELPRILSVSHLLVGMCYLIQLWGLGIQRAPPRPHAPFMLIWSACTGRLCKSPSGTPFRGREGLCWTGEVSEDMPEMRFHLLWIFLQTQKSLLYPLLLGRFHVCWVVS